MTGAFTDVTLPTFTDPQLFWNTADLYTTGQITAIPEPATLLAMLAAGLPIFLKRKRGS